MTAKGSPGPGEFAHSSADAMHEVVVIGAGLAGLCAGAKLREAGIEDFVILERADDVGGTWRDNRYPGVAVDVNSFLYSFSFEQNPGWSRAFAPGAELHQYATRLTDKYDLRKHIRFHADVTAAAFDEAEHRWEVTLGAGGGVVLARHMILATGMMSQPKWPAIDGLEKFGGTVLHTAAWDDEHVLRDKRVAVIGTGASAVQVVPTIAPEVEALDVYQRTPIWVLPKPDFPMPAPARGILRAIPPARSVMRMATGMAPDLLTQVGILRDRELPLVTTALEQLGRTQLRLQVRDPDLRARLTPNYDFGCKRPGLSNEYLPAFNRPNVELVTSGIKRITSQGIRTEDGRLRPVDTIVLATGFKIFERGGLPPFEIANGKGRDLRAFWDEERHQASNGTTVLGYPNFFLLAGPYGLYSQSYLAMIEANTAVTIDCIREAHRRRATRVEVREEVHARQFEHTQRRMRSTSFFNRDCASSHSYYFDKNGDAPMVRPISHPEMWLRRRRPRTADYRYDSH